MRRRGHLATAFGALGAFGAAIGVAGCGYPTFSLGSGGAGSGSTASASSSRGSSSSGVSSSASSSAGTGSGGAGGAPSSASSASSSGALSACPINHLVLGEVQTHGLAGPTDEFVELYNPTMSPIQLDASWRLEGRGLGDTQYSARWTAGNATVAPHSHFLIAGKMFDTSLATPDDTLTVSITDAGSLILQQSGVTVDALCYIHDNDLVSAADFVDPVDPYTCANLPALNPHYDTTGDEGDASMARKPGGPAGNCTDTGDNSLDFIEQSPPTPLGTHNPPAP